MDAPLENDRTGMTRAASEATGATRPDAAADVTLATSSPGSLGHIDRYALLRELGGGGFGVVYLARDAVAGVDVAVKGLPPLVRNNRDELERIRENFALVSRLYHPHIAPALVLHQAQEVQYGDERVREALRVLPGDYLMVMAYAPGVTLGAWRRSFPERRVPVGEALAVCRQIASALDYAHGEKIIHRDVKPSNVVVETAAGGAVRCRVLDFGLAAEIHSSLSRISAEVCDTSGTRPYMAPEQWQGKPQGPQTDQYALAAVFYELVSGQVPLSSAFETGDVAVMVAAVLGERPAPLPQLTDAQNRSLLRGLSKDAPKRFASCTELVSALAGAADGTARAAATARVPGRLAWFALAAMGACALAFYAGHRAVARSQQSRSASEAARPEAPLPTLPPPAAVVTQVAVAPAAAPAASQELSRADAKREPPPAAAPAAAAPAEPAVSAAAAPAAPAAAAKPPPPAEPLLVQDLIGALAGKVRESVPAGAPVPVRVGIGCWTSGEGQLMAAYSSVLREGLQRALAADSRFEVVSGERLSALLLGGGPAARTLLMAGAPAGAARLEGVEVLLRGRFTSFRNEVRVLAELAWLRSGETVALEAATPAAREMERLWPGADTSQASMQLRLAEVLVPQNEVASLKNVLEVESRARQVPHDFAVRLVTSDARQDYAEGEPCRYVFSSEVGCHVAVFCHQVDGASVVLFPNRWSLDSWVPAGQEVRIPGEGKGGFEITISPPFGADVVQVVACTALSPLHKCVAEVTSRAAPSQAFGVLARGVQTAALDRGLSEAGDRSGADKWSEAHLVICTYPKAAGWAR